VHHFLAEIIDVLEFNQTFLVPTDTLFARFPTLIQCITCDRLTYMDCVKQSMLLLGQGRQALLYRRRKTSLPVPTDTSITLYCSQLPIFSDK